MNIKIRIWEIVEVAKEGDKLSKTFDIFILTLIALNVIAVIFGTVQIVDKNMGSLLYGFEIISVVIFTIEYLMRLWSCTSDAKYSSAVLGRLRFAIQGMSLVDLLAILPFYLPFTGIDLRFIRAFRLFRILRIAKVGRYYASLRIITNVIKQKKEELVLTFFIVFLILIIGSSVMYYVESPVQPDKFADIPTSMWWGIVTLTTVGYGDVYPITTLGRFVGAFLSISGIVAFALPTGILGAGFIDELRKLKNKKITCPHCGTEIDT